MNRARGRHPQIAVSTSSHPALILVAACLFACDSPSSDGEAGSSSGGTSTTELDASTAAPGTSAVQGSSGTTGQPQDGVTTDTGATTSTSDGEGDSSSTGGGPSHVDMQVLSIHGGRFMRSCDDGETWSDMWEHDTEADCFHDEDSLYARPAFGNGTFVVPSGWGAPGAIYTSVDGAEWTRTAPVRVGDGETVDANSAGVFFDGKRFGVLRDLRSANGIAWSREGDMRPPNVGNVRRLAWSIEDGLLVVLGNDSEVFVSTDWGTTWSDPASGAAACDSGQHRGDVAIMEGRIVLGGGLICVSEDAGLTWTTVTPHSNVEDLFATPTGFVAIHSDDAVSRSPDGLSWELVGELGVEPSSVAGTWGGAGDRLFAYAAFGAEADAQLLRSDDGGVTWDSTGIAPGTGCPRINFGTYRVPAETCG